MRKGKGIARSFKRNEPVACKNVNQLGNQRFYWGGIAEFKSKMIKFNVQSTKQLAMRNLLLTTIACVIAHAGVAQLAIGAHYNYHRTLAVSAGNTGTAPQGLSIMALFRPEGSSWSLGLEFGSSGYNLSASDALLSLLNMVWSMPISAN